MTLEDRGPSDDSVEAQLDLIDEDDDILEPDTSDENVTEAGMSDGDFVMVPADDITFEEDSGEAR